MKNLLIINTKLNSLISEIENISNCEILIIKKNLRDVLKKKPNEFNKVILITENILPRNSENYRTIKKFINNENSFFIEIGFKKSKVPEDKAFSNALINGSGKQTKLILEKIIDIKNA